MSESTDLPQYQADPNAQYAPQAYGAPAPQASEAGKGMSITAIILGIFVPILGIVFGAIGMNRNKKAGGDGK
ncbi:MAG: hypothetical protein IKZ87_09010, partial [Actinomycetaceae bacterium]|nr:hypothetical protein [Actinomycetaceae bacterium]